MKIPRRELKKTIEATIFIAGKPISAKEILETVLAGFEISKRELTSAFLELEEDYKDRGVNLVKSSSGYSFVSCPDINETLSKFWEQKAPSYSKALLETLALIIYQQPVTKGDIEGVRGVSVSRTVFEKLYERGWIQKVGHKEVPGRPDLYGTTKKLLDDLKLTSLDQMPKIDDLSFSNLPADRDLKNILLNNEGDGQAEEQ